jgi:hypothetical protein
VGIDKLLQRIHSNNMQITDLDPVLTLLIVLLGALIAYVLDEILIVTPRISAWIGRVMGES